MTINCIHYLLKVNNFEFKWKFKSSVPESSNIKSCVISNYLWWILNFCVIDLISYNLLYKPSIRPKNQSQTRTSFFNHNRKLHLKFNMKLKTIGLFVMMFAAHGCKAMRINRNQNDSRIRRISVENIKFNQISTRKSKLSRFRSILPPNYVDDVFGWIRPETARVIRRRVSNRVLKTAKNRNFGRFLKSSGFRRSWRL